jgi:hypothetical protein
MTTEQIEELIWKYDLRLRDGRLYCRSSVTKDELETIKETKAEVIAYFEEKESAEKAQWKAKEDFLKSVPGLEEIKTANYQWSAYMDSFNRAFESEDGIYPNPPFKQTHLQELRDQYPNAVFVLNLLDRQNSENYEIATIAENTLNALIAGTSFEEARANFDKAQEDFVNRHRWD